MKKSAVIIKISLFFLAINSFLFCCREPASSTSSKTMKSDRAANRELNIRNSDTLETLNLQSRVKNELGLTEIQLKKDTLELVSSSGFLYYPFGKYKNINDFIQKNEIWSGYKTDVIDTADNTTLYKLTFKNSFINFLKSPDSKTLEIVKVKVFDPKILLINGIKIGESKGDFFKTFFNTIDNRNIQNVNVVKFESVVTGIWNYYYFKNDRLSYFTFDTDYIFRDR